MPNTRSFLFIALICVGYLLWQQWQQDYVNTVAVVSPSPVDSNANPSASPTHVAGADVPHVPTDSTPSVPTIAAKPTVVTASSDPTIEVTTDVFKLTIAARGGNIVRADLLAYPIAPKDWDHPVRLLNEDGEHYFVAQTGLISSTAPAPDHQALFAIEQSHYAFADGATTLEVPLTWIDASGIKVKKVYVFKRDSYVIEERQEISNSTPAAWVGFEYRQLQRVPPPVASGGFSFTNPDRNSFVGAAWYSPQQNFEKLRFDKYDPKAPLDRTIQGGWAALLQHYFFAAWIPPADETDRYSTGIVTGSAATRYVIRTLSPAITVEPGQTKQVGARLYVGPKLQAELGQVAPKLELVVDYGIFTVIAQPLFNWALSPLHSLVGNWGWAIVLVTILLKLVFFKLSEAQYRSMAKMKKLQPRLAAVKERYGDDKQKYQSAMMELYQKEKINPIGGCLPMLVQFPVFIALYWVLLESVELRQAPFIGWVQNLSAPDPYFVLPILNGAAMIASQLLSPTTGMDPTQAKMMKIMPFVFSIMFAFFPAGLVLYWTVNGTLSLIQQWVITKRIEAGAKA